MVPSPDYQGRYRAPVCGVLAPAAAQAVAEVQDTENSALNVSGLGVGSKPGRWLAGFGPRGTRGSPGSSI